MVFSRAVAVVLISVQSFSNALPHSHGKKHGNLHGKKHQAHMSQNSTTGLAAHVVAVSTPAPQQLCSVSLPRHAVSSANQDDALGWLDKVFGKQEEGSYNIPEQDKTTILSSALRFGKEPAVECSEDSYGEILQSSAAKLFNHPLVQLKPGDTFVDMGSGLGQLVMDAVLLGEAKRAVGVELSASRTKEACSVLQEVSKALPVSQLSGWRATRHESQTEIYQGDLFGLPDDLLKEINVAYVANLCFRPAMLAALGEKLGTSLSDGARVASLRKFENLSEKSRLKLKGTVDLPMSWSVPGYGQAVYIYKVE